MTKLTDVVLDVDELRQLSLLFRESADQVTHSRNALHRLALELAPARAQLANQGLGRLIDNTLTKLESPARLGALSKHLDQMSEYAARTRQRAKHADETKANGGPAARSSRHKGSSPIYAAAQRKADRVAPIPLAGQGWRSYSIGIGSYLSRRGGYVYASHRIYIDTRNLPYGHKLWLTVSTQRSDGKWARAHEKPILVVTGKQKIQEIILEQRRGIGGGLDLTRVHVQHTATTPGSTAVIPHGSTLEGTYRPWNGPEASPRR